MFAAASGLCCGRCCWSAICLARREFILVVVGRFYFWTGPFTGLHLSDSSWAYVGTQGGIAFIMSLVTGNGPPNSLAPATNRLGGMMFGVLVTFGALLALQLCRPALSKILPRII